MIDVLHVLTEYSDAVGGPEAVYLLPLLLLLEGEDRPQHGRADGGTHSCPPCQVRLETGANTKTVTSLL